MSRFRIAAPVALVGALGLVGVPILAGSSSHSAPAAAAENAPVAVAVGGDAGPLVYPSILNVRLVRGEAALQRLTEAVDENDAAGAQVALTTVTTSMYQAWAAAVYVIQTTPPPVAGADALLYAAGGPPTASPEQGGSAVLSFEHDAITTGIGLLDGPTVALRPALRSTIDLMIRMRIAEIDYIKSIAPPPVAVPDSIDAHASGAPVAASWNTLMPDVAAMICDEVQQLRGTAPVDAPTVLSFRTWQARDLATQMTIAAYWPPLPADG
jgi:hypothetical protein